MRDRGPGYQLAKRDETQATTITTYSLPSGLLRIKIACRFLFLPQNVDPKNGGNEFARNLAPHRVDFHRIVVFPAFFFWLAGFFGRHLFATVSPSKRWFTKTGSQTDFLTKKHFGGEVWIYPP